jgi:hypothetical protein
MTRNAISLNNAQLQTVVEGATTLNPRYREKYLGIVIDACLGKRISAAEIERVVSAAKAKIIAEIHAARPGRA